MVLKYYFVYRPKNTDQLGGRVPVPVPGTGNTLNWLGILKTCTGLRPNIRIKAGYPNGYPSVLKSGASL
jgi:hypothetical protein